MARVPFRFACAVAAALAASSASAVTPTQNAVDAARAKAEQAARLKVQAEAKARQDAIARTKAAEQARSKAQAIGAESVFGENKRRLAAALAAEAIQQRIRDAHASIGKGAGGTGPKIAGHVVRHTHVSPSHSHTADARPHRITRK